MRRDLEGPDYIAGRKTVEDWRELRGRLRPNAVGAWQEAFTDFFMARLESRYFRPIRLLQEHGTFSGEGFSVLAIQCSLIEFLESTIQGWNYRYGRSGDRLGPYSYSSSRTMFTSFLRHRAPFSAAFNELSADDFYVGVRCGLLHEARTKNGWRVWAKSEDGRIVDTLERIVFRNDFQEALLRCVESYGRELQKEAELQEAFIRKFDDLCA